MSSPTYQEPDIELSNAHPPARSASDFDEVLYLAPTPVGAAANETYYTGPDILKRQKERAALEEEYAAERAERMRHKSMGSKDRRPPQVDRSTKKVDIGATSQQAPQDAERLRSKSHGSGSRGKTGTGLRDLKPSFSVGEGWGSTKTGTGLRDLKPPASGGTPGQSVAGKSDTMKLADLLSDFNI